MRSGPRYQPGDKIGGRYHVHQALMGGMGEVYLCLDLDGMIPIVLKTFQHRFLTSPKLRSAFQEEVAIWIKLGKHPNIVRCFSMDILDNRPFMLLEWITNNEGPGTDLRSWLRYGPLDLRMALDFVIDVCQGLIHAHREEPYLVHRDLKPENILIAQGYVAKITDFGLAKVVQSGELEIGFQDAETDRHSLVGRGGIVGTPLYMSPEQWLGGVMDAQTDTYAVGCILYELLAGQPPYEAPTWDGLRRQHLEADIPRLSHRRSLPVKLDVLLSRCLAKQRDRRICIEELSEQLAGVYERQFTERPRTVPVSDQFEVEDYVARAGAYMRLKQYDRALSDLSCAIQLAPNLGLVYSNRGGMYHEMGRYEDALADFNKAIELGFESSVVYSNRAGTYCQLGRYQEALENYSKAIELDPNNVSTITNRGATYSELHREEEALADFTRVIQITPHDPRVYVNRGTSYAALEYYEEALQDFQKAIELDPSLATAYFKAGAALLALDRREEGITFLAKAAELGDTAVQNLISKYAGLVGKETSDASPIGQDLTAQDYFEQGTMLGRAHQYDRALEYLSRAIELSPGLSLAYTHRGNVYLELQHFQEALRDHNRALEIDSTSAIYWINRGNTYSALSEFDKALSDYSRAVELDPSYALAYTNRGLLFRSLSRFEEALADFRVAMQLDPYSAQNYLLAGALLAEKGDFKEALHCFDKANSLGDQRGADLANRLRLDLMASTAPQVEGEQLLLAFTRFFAANSLEQMRLVVEEFSFMTHPSFIAKLLVKVGYLKVPAVDQRLAWLRQIADE